MDFLIVLLAICFAVGMAAVQTFLMNNVPILVIYKLKKENRKSEEVGRLVADLKNKIEKLRQLGKMDEYKEVYEKLGVEKVIDSYCGYFSLLGSYYLNSLNGLKDDPKKSLEITNQYIKEATPELKRKISFVERMIADVERMGRLQKQG